VREHLARLYGTEHERILDLVEREPSLGARLSTRDDVLDIAAQVVFAVTDEGACTLSDIIDRRLVLGTVGPVSAAEMRAVADVAAPVLGWSDAGAAAAVAAELDRRAAIEALWRRPA
jgi:glycerol-3-phosphate dehydrogenase